VKPTLEKIERSFESSFTIKKFDKENSNSDPKWHVHPEYEIVYISEGCKGRRHIGNHISSYENGDLLFLGPNIPHYGFTTSFRKEHFEIVVQLDAHFLGHTFLKVPEMLGIRQLFEKSKAGISFNGLTKIEIGNDLLQMTEMNSFDRLLRLLRIFQKMETSNEFELLNVENITLEVDRKDSDRMNSINKYVRAHYQDVINLEDIAGEVLMTVPSFCRYFKQQTGKTFTLFVNEYRIRKACNLLANTTQSITEICFECGFNNMSHFNKHFKMITGQTPGNYRKGRKIILG